MINTCLGLSRPFILLRIDQCNNDDLKKLTNWIIDAKTDFQRCLVWVSGTNWKQSNNGTIKKKKSLKTIDLKLSYRTLKLGDFYRFSNHVPTIMSIEHTSLSDTFFGERVICTSLTQQPSNCECTHRKFMRIVINWKIVGHLNGICMHAFPFQIAQQNLLAFHLIQLSLICRIYLYFTNEMVCLCLMHKIHSLECVKFRNFCD